MLAGIKKLFGNYYLGKEIVGKKRQVSVFNLENAKTIGIIFDSSDPEEFELVKKYVLYLREWKKKVKGIGFFSQKRVPNLSYSKLDYDFFNLKDLNWWGRPSEKYINIFLADDWDVLIDLNIHDRFPLRYIAAKSKARFKIGKYSEKNKLVHDMLIETDPKHGLKYYLRQVDIYLQMINKKVEQPSA